MAEVEVVRIMRENLEGLLPKVCSICRLRFGTLREYLLTTTHRGPARPYDADMGDGGCLRPLGTLTNADCPCGTTLALSSGDIPPFPTLGVVGLRQARDENGGGRRCPITFNYDCPSPSFFVGVMNGPSTTVTAFNETSEWIHHNYIRNPRFHGLFLQYLGKPLLLEFNGGGPEWLKQTGQVAVDERHFTIRGMSAQHQANHHNQLGYWTWMDGVLRQPVTMFNGKPEAMTASVAFFDGEGWKGRTAFGRRGGWTYVESFRQALE